MDRIATSSWLKGKSDYRYWFTVVICHIFVLLFFIVSISAVNIRSVENRVSSSYSSLKRHYNNQSFREITFLSKGLMENDINLLEIFDNNGYSVFKIGDAKKYDIRVTHDFITNVSRGITNGRLVYSFSLTPFVLIGLYLFLAFLLFSAPLSFYIHTLTKRKQLKLIEIEQTKMLGKIARQVTHDLQVPIKILQKQLKDNPLVSNTTFAVLERLELISKKLMKDGEIESRFNNELINFNKEIGKIIDEMTIIYPDINCRIESTLNFCVYGSLSELQRCLVNLIKNAIEACTEVGVSEIKISVINKNGMALMEIANASKRVDSKIFEMLNSGVGVSTKNTGNGIGFVGAKEIIESHNGMLTISPLDDGRVIVGVTFCEFIEVNPQKIIHIEDDKFIQKSWSLEARKYPKTTLISLKSPLEAHDEFLSSISNDTVFFVDENFDGEVIKGTDFLTTLYRKGFKRLFLATAETQYKGDLRTKHLKIVGKDFPKVLFSS